MVGVPGVEPGTSSLSGTRSNQLSYTPDFAVAYASGYVGLSPLMQIQYVAAKPDDAMSPPRGRNQTSLPCVARHNNPTDVPLPCFATGYAGQASFFKPRCERSMVEATGVEPVTPSLQSSCSAN